MAKEEKVEGAEAPPKKSKKMLIIIIAVVLLVVLIGGGAAAFFMMKKGDAEGEGGEEVAAESSKAKKNEKKVPPVFIALDTFTVNLVPETTEQYLQVGISLEAEDPAMAEQVKLYTPRLRHEIMDILSSKKPSEVSSREGKKLLSEEIRKAINGIIEAPAVKGKPPADAVTAVLFTTFIVQ